MADRRKAKIICRIVFLVHFVPTNQFLKYSRVHSEHSVYTYEAVDMIKINPAYVFNLIKICSPVKPLKVIPHPLIKK